MPRKKGKSISFDAMVKFFLHTYDIPTKRDVEKLMGRLDRLETMIASAAAAGRGRAVRRRGGVPAAEAVLGAIKRSRQGLKFADIQAKTGFVDKKIRNIIFRLNKLGKIKRHSRGVYVAL
ncbi:MAG: hypothetical protein MUC33_09415 [Desulfobacterales bacterium]|jgi:hypothetical protein|nr:hypothetical protein [Desulfobacterales bacterium]